MCLGKIFLQLLQDGAEGTPARVNAPCCLSLPSVSAQLSVCCSDQMAFPTRLQLIIFTSPDTKLCNEVVINLTLKALWFFFFFFEPTSGCVFQEALDCHGTGRLGSRTKRRAELNKIKSWIKDWLWGISMALKMYFSLKTTSSSLHYTLLTTFLHDGPNFSSLYLSCDEYKYLI